MMKFKEVADALAKEQGLTNTEVAEMIGMSKANYSHEKGHNDNLSLYLKVCDALGARLFLEQVSVGTMLGMDSLHRMDNYYREYVKSSNTSFILIKSTESIKKVSNKCHYYIISKAGKTYNFTTINK